jgi:aminoglycoside phosphotransferase (APT) family kinase protein
MAAFTPENTALLPLLPEDRVGTVERIETIVAGLSGAGVYGVTTSRGEFVLRVQRQQDDDRDFPRQLLVLQRAADAGIAPRLVHVDEAARAVVSERVRAMPIAAVLGDPEKRMVMIGSIVEQLRLVHALDASGIEERSPLIFARKAWEAARGRAGFPPWAASLEPVFDAAASALAADPRRSLNHNDMNPTNALWDGTRAWLVDWEVAAVGHPYYDLATLALFLRFDDDVAFRLVQMHDGAAPDDRARETFRSLRKLVGVLAGLTFLGLVPDLGVRPAPTLEDAPSLGDVYASMGSGQLNVQSPYGIASMGLALLKESLGTAA